MDEGLKIIGEGTFILFNKYGDIKDVRELIANILLTDGFDAVCAQMGSTSQPGQFDKIAIGTGTTSPVVGNTALEYLVADAQGTYSHTNDTKIWSVEHTFSAGTPQFEATITESGVYNAAGGGGTLLNRQTFGGLAKGTDDSLKITWQFTLA
jgi:hypothetical protein